MHRPCHAIWIASVFALVAPPQFAAAGLISWSYTAKVEAADGGTLAHFGNQTHYWSFSYPSGPPGAPTNTIITGQNEYQVIANIGASVSGQHSGSTSPAVSWPLFVPPWERGIPIASIGPAQVTTYDLGDQWAAQIPADFWLRVRITDDASGEFRDLSYRLLGSSSPTFTTGSASGGSTTTSTVPSISVEERIDTFVLCGNQYSVDPFVRGFDAQQDLVMDVAVSSAAATPEPGALALAAIGLSGVYLRRRMRCSAIGRHACSVAAER